MPKKLKAIRLSDSGWRKLEWLSTNRYSTESTAMEIAIEKLYQTEKENFEMNDKQKNELAKRMVKNGIDWYALLMDDGSVDLRHETGLSNILQCGQDPAEFGIAKMFRCGADTAEEAIEQIEQDL